LILEMFKHTDSPLSIKVGMHQVLDRENKTQFEQAKKHASYLASISEHQLLTSRLIQDHNKQQDLYKSQTFHSSMTPDGEVYCIDALTSQSLIESQAREIMSLHT
jgi:hypothetical protein